MDLVTLKLSSLFMIFFISQTILGSGRVRYSKWFKYLGYFFENLHAGSDIGLTALCIFRFWVIAK